LLRNEHTAVFECVNSKNNSFNVEKVAQDLQAMVDAAHLGITHTAGPFVLAAVPAADP